MRAGIATLAFAMSIAACGSAEPAKQPVDRLEGGGTNNATKLSYSAELFLIALTASTPKPLTKDELCENGGVCGDDFKAALGELSAQGLIRQASNEAYQLTDSGSRYVDQNYEVVRDGDNVSIETRKGSTP